MKKLLPVVPIQVMRDYAKPAVQDKRRGFADSLESAKNFCKMDGFTIVEEDFHFTMLDHPEPAYVIFVTRFNNYPRTYAKKTESVQNIEQDMDIEVIPVQIGRIEKTGFYFGSGFFPLGGIGTARSIAEAIRMVHDQGYKIIIEEGSMEYDEHSQAWHISVWPMVSVCSPSIEQKIKRGII